MAAFLNQALPGPAAAAPAPWVNPYQGGLDDATAALNAPQAPMYTAEEQAARKDANARARKWGMLGLMMGDEGQAKAGGQVLRQAMEAAGPRVTDQGVFDPTTGTMKVNPEFARNKLQSRQERLQDLAARAQEGQLSREDTQAFQQMQLHEQIASRNQNAQLQREAMKGNRDAQDQQRKSGVADKLSDDFMRISKDDLAIKNSFTDLQSLPNGGAGDVAFIFRYMKLLDPTSVVREGEFDTAKKTQGIPNRVWQYFQGLKNGGILSPEARQDMLAGAAKMSVNADTRLAKNAEFYGNRARDLNVPQEWVIPSYARNLSADPNAGLPDVQGGAAPGARPPAAPATNAVTSNATGNRPRVTDAASYNALPPGAVYIDPNGKVKTKGQ